MSEAIRKIGLLSTAEDPQLVGKVLKGLNLSPKRTDVILLNSAPSVSGQPQYEAAEQAYDALSAARFSVQVVSAEDVTKETIAWPPEGPKERETLLVVSDGDKNYLRDQLKRTGINSVVRRAVTASDLAVVTIGAGTENMGMSLEIPGDTHPDGHEGGFNLIPATVICHFDAEKAKEIFDTQDSQGRGRRIVGIPDTAALIGNRTSDLQTIPGSSDVTVFRRTSNDTSYNSAQTNHVILR